MARVEQAGLPKLEEGPLPLAQFRFDSSYIELLPYACETFPDSSFTFECQGSDKKVGAGCSGLGKLNWPFLLFSTKLTVLNFTLLCNLPPFTPCIP